MSKDLIKRAREFAALAEKATPGPWKVLIDEGAFIGTEGDPSTGRRSQVVIDGGCEDPVRNYTWLEAEEEDLKLAAASWSMAKLLAEMADKLERTRKALRILASAADPFLADQSQATDERVALVQPVTVKEAEELNAAYREAREVLDETSNI